MSRRSRRKIQKFGTTSQEDPLYPSMPRVYLSKMDTPRKGTKRKRYVPHPATCAAWTKYKRTYNPNRETAYIMNEWRVQSRRPNKSIQKALNGPVWMKENVCIVNGEYYKEYAFDGKIEWKMGIPNEALCLASIARGYPRTKLVLSHAMEFSVFVPDSCTVPERCRAVSQRRVDRKALARVNDIVCVMEYFHSKNQPFSTVFTRGILDRGIFVRHEGSIPRTVETSNMLQ